MSPPSSCCPADAAGRYIYERGCANGKRVQVRWAAQCSIIRAWLGVWSCACHCACLPWCRLCSKVRRAFDHNSHLSCGGGCPLQANMGAKNHAVVMPDANVEATTSALVRRLGMPLRSGAGSKTAGSARTRCVPESHLPAHAPVGTHTPLPRTAYPASPYCCCACLPCSPQVGAAFGAAGQRCMAISAAVFVGGMGPYRDALIEKAKSLKVRSGRGVCNVAWHAECCLASAVHDAAGTTGATPGSRTMALQHSTHPTPGVGWVGGGRGCGSCHLAAGQAAHRAAD